MKTSNCRIRASRVSRVKTLPKAIIVKRVVIFFMFAILLIYCAADKHQREYDARTKREVECVARETIYKQCAGSGA